MSRFARLCLSSGFTYDRFIEYNNASAHLRQKKLRLQLDEEYILEPTIFPIPLLEASGLIFGGFLVDFGWIFDGFFMIF